MQGAPKKTSGRSYPWNATLRATSSGIGISTWRAVPKPLKIQAGLQMRFVGFALGRERFTSDAKRNATTGPKRCGKGQMAEGLSHSVA
jgi:hypothetical protein